MVSNLIKFRPNPAANPLTLLSCSDDDSEVEWMKVVEEEAPFCSELDDYVAEKAEVLADQGSAFPFTKGMWIISMLVGAINPYDLDAMDESLPFTKSTLDDLLGRCHTADEYRYYFDRNTHGALYSDMYQRFLAVGTCARMLVPEEEQRRREDRAGYVAGKPVDPTGGGRVHPSFVTSCAVPVSVSPSLPPPPYIPPSSCYSPPPPAAAAVASAAAQYRPTPTYNNAPSPSTRADLPPAY